MKRLGELDNIQLLYEVKADALQPIDELIDDMLNVKRINRSFLMKAWMKCWLILSRWICMNT